MKVDQLFAEGQAYPETAGTLRGKRIGLGFSLVVGVVLLLAAFLYERQTVLSTNLAAITEDSMPSLKILAELRADNQENALLTYKMVSATSDPDMDRLEAQIKGIAERISKDLNTYEGIASPACKVLMQDVNKTREQFKAKREEIMRLSREATNAEATAALYAKSRAELDPIFEQFVVGIQKCVDQENVEAADATQAAKAAQLSSIWSLIIGSLLCVGLASLLGYLITSNTTRVMKNSSAIIFDSSGQVAAAAGQVSTTSQTLAEGSGAQAASVEECSASLEEMSSMTRRNAENAQKANEVAKHTRTVAERGANDMQNMSQAMPPSKPPRMISPRSSRPLMRSLFKRISWP